MYSPDEQGNWVRYSAYAAIEAQVTALKAENERLRNAAQALADVMETCVEENNGMPEWTFKEWRNYGVTYRRLINASSRPAGEGTGEAG
jgi:hypothetical protein